MKIPKNPQKQAGTAPAKVSPPAAQRGDELNLDGVVSDSYADGIVKRCDSHTNLQEIRETEVTEHFRKFLGVVDPNNVFAHDLEHFNQGFTHISEQQVFALSTAPRTRGEYWNENTAAMYVQYAGKLFVGTVREMAKDLIKPGVDATSINKLNKMVVATGMLHTVGEHDYAELIQQIASVRTPADGIAARKRLNSLLSMAIRKNTTTERQMREGVTVANAYRAALLEKTTAKFGEERAEAILNFDRGDHVPELSETEVPDRGELSAKLGKQELVDYAGARDFMAPHRFSDGETPAKLSGIAPNNAVKYAMSLLPADFEDEFHLVASGIPMLQDLVTDLMSEQVTMNDATAQMGTHFARFNGRGNFRLPDSTQR